MRGVPTGRPAPFEAAIPLTDARDRLGQSPRSWLAHALSGSGSPGIDLRTPVGGETGLLELRCGDTARLSHPATPAALAHPGALPVRTRSVVAATLDMCLPSVPRLDDLFAELRRVLRPTGTIAALVPARPRHRIVEARVWGRLHRALGGRPRFRNESTRDALHWLIAAADFAVLMDQRRTFRLPVPDGETAVRVVDGLVVSGVWPSVVTGQQLVEARRELTRYAAPGRTLPIPLRLLVARR